MRNRVLRDEEGALQVYRENPVEYRFIHRLKVASEKNARIGEDDIQPTVRNQQTVYAFPNGGGVRHISWCRL